MPAAHSDSHSHSPGVLVVTKMLATISSTARIAIMMP